MPLDNVIWQALTTHQSHLAQGQGTARKFFKEVSILAALAEPSGDAWNCLASLLRSGESAGLFLTDPPPDIPHLRIISSIALLQMVRNNGEMPTTRRDRPAFVTLGDADVPEMLSLTSLTKPGPFGTRTREMGDYIGIRKIGSLVAMVGERLKIPGYTEISAVCTHPAHLGHGYATAMILELMGRIHRRGETPFLHVRPENTRAVGLYEHLGFRTRVELQYTIVTRQ